MLSALPMGCAVWRRDERNVTERERKIDRVPGCQQIHPRERERMKRERERHGRIERREDYT